MELLLGGQFDSVWRCECVGWWNVCVEVGLLDDRTVFSGDPHSPPVTFGVNETVKTVTTKALNDIMVSPLIFTDFSKLV